MIPEKQEAQVYRPIATPGQKNVYPGSATHSIKILIQPFDSLLSASDPAFSKTFRGFCEIDENVKESDRIVLDNETYHVVSINKHNYGKLKHLELILEKIK